MTAPPYRPPGRTRGAVTGLLAVLLALCSMVALVLGAGAVEPQSAAFVSDRVPVVGRTHLVCTVAARAPAGPDGSEDDGAEPPSADIWAAVMRVAPGREGTLTGTPLDDSAASLTLTEQGKGQVLPGVDRSVVLQGVGVMARASSAAVLANADEGETRGLMAAPCGAPGTAAWLVGVGATDDYRSELVLANPDDSQAELDLRFYGRNGLVVVPGSPGLVVEARSSTVVSLEPLVGAEGPLTVAVRAHEGRVSAIARTLASADLKPDGADWQTASAAPSLRSVIPGIPEGEGSRELFVVNPGGSRAEVTVEVLGEQGSFAPVGAERIDVAPESTASVQLDASLAGAPGAIRLTSTVPVTGAVVSRSSAVAGAPDLSVQSATTAVVGPGLVPVATTDVADSDLILSNDSDVEVMAAMEVMSYDGVVLRRDDILLAPNSTSTRRLNSPAPSYLVVRAPQSTGVHGAVVHSQSDGEVAGLTTLPIASPDLASRAPQVVLDPTVGR